MGKGGSVRREIELNIDRSEKVIELLVPLLDCDLVITNEMTGSFAGICSTPVEG